MVVPADAPATTIVVDDVELVLPPPVPFDTDADADTVIFDDVADAVVIATIEVVFADDMGVDAVVTTVESAVDVAPTTRIDDVAFGDRDSVGVPLLVRAGCTVSVTSTDTLPQFEVTLSVVE